MANSQVLGEMVVKITADMEGLKKGLADAQAAIAKQQKSTTTMLDNVSKSLTSLGTKLTVGLTLPVALAGKSFIQLSMQMDSATVALTRMVGGADKAKKLLDDLKKFGAETPFEFSGLVEVTKQLVGFKVPAEEVIDVMKNLGNAAGGNQERLERLALAYGKLNVKGKASMEELNMFLEAGVPILDELSKQFGVSTAQIYKMVETGKIGFDDVNKALTSLTTGTGMFAGILEEQSQTLGGALSNLKDQIGIVGVEIVKSFEPALRAIIKAVSDVVEWFSELDQNTKDIIAGMVIAAAAIGPVILAMGQFASSLNNIATIGRFLIPILASISGPLLIIAGIAGALGIAFSVVSKDARDYANALEDAKEITEQSEETLARTTSMKAQEAIARLQNTSAILQETKAITEYELKSAEESVRTAAVVDPRQEENVVRLKDKLFQMTTQINDNAQASRSLVDAYNTGAFSLDKLTGRVKENNKANDEGKGSGKGKGKSGEMSEAFKERLNIQKDFADKVQEIEMSKFDILAVEESKYIDKVKGDEQTITNIKKFYSEERKKIQAEEMMAQIQFASNTVSQIGGLFQQYATNRNLEIDADKEKQLENIGATYDAEVKAINDAQLSVEERNKKMKELDEKRAKDEKDINDKADKEKRKVAYDLAVTQKATNIANTIMNTAVAVMKGFAELGPIGGLIAQAIVTGIGVAQVALIAQTPLPKLARGGVFEGAAVIGEAGKEMAIPLEGENSKPAFALMANAIMDNINTRINNNATIENAPAQGSADTGGRGGDIYLDGQRLGEWIYNATASGQVLIADRAVVK